MGEGDDIADLAAKAKVLAEASGRSEEEVMADLLDDGYSRKGRNISELLLKTEEDMGTLVEELVSLILISLRLKDVFNSNQFVVP